MNVALRVNGGPCPVHGLGSALTWIPSATAWICAELVDLPGGGVWPCSRFVVVVSNN